MRKLAAAITLVLTFGLGAVTTSVLPAGGNVPSRPSKEVRQLQRIVLRLGDRYDELQESADYFDITLNDHQNALDDLDTRLFDAGL